MPVIIVSSKRRSRPYLPRYPISRRRLSDSNRSLFDHAWRYVRGHRGGDSSLVGVGMYEAREFHHRAYSGIGGHGMLPAEIGHAAAYEAYRTWIHNSSIYEPLSGDTERQREGLVGLAVAEGRFSTGSH
jgi:hypothetical protein